MKRKIKYKEDDGHTIYDMSNLPTNNTKINKKDNLYVSRKEKKVIIKAAFETYLPMFIVILVGFILAGFLIYFWLN